MERNVETQVLAAAELLLESYRQVIAARSSAWEAKDADLCARLCDLACSYQGAMTMLGCWHHIPKERS